MKTNKILLLSFTLLTASLLVSQTNFVEDFDLNLGSLNNQNMWQGNTTFQVTSDAMTLMGYPQANSDGKVLRVQSSGGNISRGNLLPTSFASGAAYLSFLVRIDDAGQLPAFPQLQLGLEKATFTTTFAGLGFYQNPVDDQIEVALTTQSIADEQSTDGADLSVNTVYHVVLKYEYVAAANDELKLYISPTFMPTEPASPNLQTTVNGTGLADEIGRLLIDAPVGSSGMMTVDGVQFGNAWNGEFDTGLLPVTLADFEGDLRDGTAYLRWRTLSETNNDRFEIERSTDGRIFEMIGEVSGFGNSQSEIDYRFRDYRLSPGLNYYRLAQYDYSGEMSRSEVLILNNTVMSPDLHLYPNPTTDFVYFDCAPASVKGIRAIHVDGLVMPIPVPAPDGRCALDVRSWNRGTYILEVMSTDGTSTRQSFVVQ